MGEDMQIPLGMSAGAVGHGPLAGVRHGHAAGYGAADLVSSGADSKRHILLRHKVSTNEWFVEDQLLLGMIRTPKSQDPWA